MEITEEGNTMCKGSVSWACRSRKNMLGVLSCMIRAMVATEGFLWKGDLVNYLTDSLNFSINNTKYEVKVAQRK